MRHHGKNRKFGRPRNQRKALIRSLAVSLIEREKIKTTEAKAKEVRPFMERLVSFAKKDTLSSRRLVLGRLGNNNHAIKKLFSDVGPRYGKRSGGYTRVTKLPIRKGDNSKMAIIEFV